MLASATALFFGIALLSFHCLSLWSSALLWAGIDDCCVACAEFLHVKPGKGAAFVRTKLKNYITGNVVDRTFRAGESAIQAVLEKRDCQYTYQDGDEVSPCHSCALHLCCLSSIDMAVHALALPVGAMHKQS